MKPESKFKLNDEVMFFDNEQWFRGIINRISLHSTNTNDYISYGIRTNSGRYSDSVHQSNVFSMEEAALFMDKQHEKLKQLWFGETK